MKMNKCEITQKYLEDKHTLRTTDNYDVSRSVFLKTQLEAQKSFISLQDTQEWFKSNKHYKNCIINILAYARKVEKVKGIPRIQVINEIVQEEEHISLLEYNKARNTLTRKEHNNIQEVILLLRDVDITNIKIPRSEILSNNAVTHSKYINNLKYYNDLNNIKVS